MSKKTIKIIDEKLALLDRSIVATPTEEYLNSFAKANHGTNDMLLMQLSKNFGYKLAMEELKEELSKANSGKV